MKDDVINRKALIGKIIEESTKTDNPDIVAGIMLAAKRAEEQESVNDVISNIAVLRFADALESKVMRIDPCKYNSAEMKWEIIRIIKDAKEKKNGN